jgi:hypothetical protein
MWTQHRNDQAICSIGKGGKSGELPVCLQILLSNQQIIRPEKLTICSTSVRPRSDSLFALICLWQISIMDVGFDSKKLRDVCESEEMLENVYGRDSSGSLMSFFADLQAATSLNELRSIYGIDSSHSGEGEFKISVTQSCEVLLRGIARSGMSRLGAEPDWLFARRVKILKIEVNHA